MIKTLCTRSYAQYLCVWSMCAQHNFTFASLAASQLIFSPTYHYLTGLLQLEGYHPALICGVSFI